MVITTQRLILRPISESDAEDMYEYSKNPNVGQNAGWKPHESINETHEILKTIFIGQENVFGMELRENGKLIGSVGIIDDPKRENKNVLMLGYAMSESYWGCGYMTEAARAVVDYGFETLGLSLISVYCYPDNARSKRVIEKLGFHYEGRLAQCEETYDGKIRDNECYALTREAATNLS